MSNMIDAFGGDGEYEVRFRTRDGSHSVWVRRDVWVDRGGGERWVVWAQHRSWDGDQPPAEDDALGSTLGSIVVSHPAVMTFIDQLGELIANPVAFRDEQEFAKGSVPSDEAE